MLGTTRRVLVRHLAAYESVVEVGIGRQVAVAAALAAAGVDVTATDIRERDVPPAVTFVVDDVTDPDREVYAGADALYGLNLPPELHRPALSVANAVDARLYFTTLGTDQPAVPVTRRSIPAETLYLASDTDPDGATSEVDRLE